MNNLSCRSGSSNSLGGKSVAGIGKYPKKIENKVGIKFTSTPIDRQKKKMELSCNNRGKLQLAIDTDSGYVSHNIESNLDTSRESSADAPSEPQNIYLSEDALLEKPSVITTKEELEDENSVINSSTISVGSRFSGFEDDASNSSAVIPYALSINFKANSTEDNPSCVHDSTFSDNSLLLDKSTASTCDNQMNSSLSDISCKKTAALTPQKSEGFVPNPNFSPDLFSDDETGCNMTKAAPKKTVTPQEKYVTKRDFKLLKNVQNSLSGVFPPPSVTIIQLTVGEMLNQIEMNKHFFWTEALQDVQQHTGTLIISGNLQKCIQDPFPNIMEHRNHGLHYNRSKISEQFELLCNKYAQRYVGAETQSSCTVFEQNIASPTKKRTSKQKWLTRSPGRRLSHLARRRITFSSANLQSSSTGSSLSRTRQILVDSKKLSLLSRRKSPRKTPSKSPFKVKRSTPSSSSKKKIHFMCEDGDKKLGTSTEMHSRRVLFKSPDTKSSSIPSTSSFLPIQNEKRSTKRALFTSPGKKSPLKGLFERKRKRSDPSDFNPTKFPHSLSMEIVKSASELRWNRSLSEMGFKANSTRFEELSDMHKKKLQWAVYESLRMQNVTPSHPQFKVFASVLARVTRRFLPSLAAKAPRPEEGTSERMLRIARHYSYAVVKGKTAVEIINEYLKNKMKNQKPQGYIGIEEFNLRNYEMNKENLLQDKINTYNENSGEKRKSDFIMKSKLLKDSKIERIRKVISFEDYDSR